MKIDGASLTLQAEKNGDRCLAWKLLIKLASCKATAKIVNCSGLIDATVGPDCVELSPSCTWDNYAIVIHDTDRIDTVLFTDRKNNAEHYGNHELFVAALDLSPLEFYFIDQNYPEVLYFGSREDFHYIQDEGGAPQRWHGPVAPVGSSVLLEDDDATVLKVVRLNSLKESDQDDKA